MNLQQAQAYLINHLSRVYDSREAATMADWILVKLTGHSKVDRLIKKDEALTETQLNSLHGYVEELVAHRPVQYVLEESYFMGLEFYVDENVLVPRPETEELVDWILKDLKGREAKVMDIGTGSGCIPVTLKSKNKSLEIIATDISNEALYVAKKNADTHRTKIRFVQHDILDRQGWDDVGMFDVIVSNPPYIPEEDKLTMNDNVLKYEPHHALFTGCDDPFIFYKEIAAFAAKHLNKGGALYFEIHELGGETTVEILKAEGFSNVELRKDIFGKDRMVKAQF
ncbi:MAG: peptide chain release factor N(5)-glutamine methyltransferase [Flavitalea sp.]